MCEKLHQQSMLTYYGKLRVRDKRIDWLRCLNKPDNVFCKMEPGEKKNHKICKCGNIKQYWKWQSTVA
jgi:hypothetical protein